MRPSCVVSPGFTPRCCSSSREQRARAAQRARQVGADVDVVPALRPVVEHVVEGDDLHHLDRADLEDLGERARLSRRDPAALGLREVQRGQQRAALLRVLRDLALDRGARLARERAVGGCGALTIRARPSSTRRARPTTSGTVKIVIATKPKHAELAEQRAPRVEEHGLEVEQHEQHRDQVELHREALVRGDDLAARRTRTGSCFSANSRRGPSSWCTPPSSAARRAARRRGSGGRRRTRRAPLSPDRDVTPRGENPGAGTPRAATRKSARSVAAGPPERQRESRRFGAIAGDTLRAMPTPVAVLGARKLRHLPRRARRARARRHDLGARPGRRRGHRARAPEPALPARDRAAARRCGPPPTSARRSQGRELVICAVPSHGVRAVMAEALPHMDPSAILVSTMKGIEVETGMLMHQVLRGRARPELPPAAGLPLGPVLRARDRGAASRPR